SQPAGELEVDAIVQLGSAARRGARPVVRLVVVQLNPQERLILVSNLCDWTWQRLSDAYKRRWGIEQFHRCLKSNLHLAHLYSFHLIGIMFLAQCVLLLAIMLWMSAKTPLSDVAKTIIEEARRWRDRLGIRHLLRRNIVVKNYRKKRRRR